MAPARSTPRSWTDPTGRTWKLFLDEDPRFAPGSLLVFVSNPSEGLDSPKVLVRHLTDTYSIPAPCLDFYLAAARAGGFVWRDRDGTPWHLSATAKVRSEGGRTLELRVSESNKALWMMSDDELQELVGQTP